ncbi:MAG: hypothetical protein AB8B51_16175 [Sedimentitalea sp.]
MMRKIVLLLTFLLPAQVYATTIDISSGEHIGFSRLVFTVPQNVQWEVEVTSEKVTLNIGVPDAKFETADVFLKIPQDRIKEVLQKAQGEPLTILLGCRCLVKSFQEGSRYIVLDVIDDQAQKMPKEDVKNEPSSNLSFPKKRNEIYPLQYFGGVSAELEVPNGFDVLSPTANQRMLKHIMARKRGWERRSQSPKLRNNLVTKTSKTGIENSYSNDVLNGVSLGLSKNIKIEGMAPNDIEPLVQKMERKNNRDECYDQEDLNLSIWSNGQSLSRQVSQIRQRLYVEFDQIDVDAARALSRVYLHFGFGAEAIEILVSLEPVLRSDRAKIAIANIIDGSELDQENPFIEQQSCLNDASLWSVFFGDVDTETVKISEILVSFAKLPMNIQKNLGPRLSRKFSVAGDQKTAAAILRILDRQGSQKDDAFALASSLLSSQSEQELRNIAESNSEYSVLALYGFLNSVYDRGGSVPFDLTVLAAGYAIENRNTSLGKKSRFSNTLSLGLFGDFRNGYSTIEDIRFLDGPDAAKNISTILFSLLTERADDVTFLEVVNLANKKIHADLNLSSKLSIANRLLDLGLSNKAMDLLVSIQGEPLDSVHVLMAKLALAQQLPHEALFFLRDIDDPEAFSLRADAFSQMEDHTNAAAIFREVGNTEAEARSSWLADIALSKSAMSATFGEISEISENLLSSPLPIDNTRFIGSSEELLEESKKSRLLIRDLLDEFVVE